MNKAKRLFEIASRTLSNGDRELAKGLAVMAMKQEDAIDALDQLLPHVPDPMPWEEFAGELTESSLRRQPNRGAISIQQVAKILEIAQELRVREKAQIADRIITQIHKLEQVQAPTRRRQRR